MGHYLDPLDIGWGNYLLGHTVRVPVLVKITAESLRSSRSLVMPNMCEVFDEVMFDRDTKRKEIAASYDYWSLGPKETFLYSTKRYKNVGKLPDIEQIKKAGCRPDASIGEH